MDAGPRTTSAGRRGGAGWRREVKVGRREAALVVSKRFAVTLADIGSVMGTAFGEVYGHLGARGAAPDGPPFVIYHGTPASGEPFDIEVCAPVARPVDPPAGWQLAGAPRPARSRRCSTSVRTTRSERPTPRSWPGRPSTATRSPDRPARST